MNKLVKGNLVRGLPSKIFENNHTCVACKKGKQHRASCKSKPVSSVSHPLQMLHMNLFGPTFIESLNKKSYCQVVTDDYSMFTWVFFLATKDETSTILKTFITGIENQINRKVKIIRCDNGTEFKNHDLNQFCGMKGIKREFSVAKTPQQNGVAERKNRTLIEAARTMLADSLLPIPFWAEAVNTAYYADEGFLVGYSVNSKALRVFNSRTRIVQETLHINFLENQPNVAGSGPKWLFDIDTLTQSMNYQPVVTGNQHNHNAGIKENLDAGKVRKETISSQQYVLLPLWSTGSKDPHNTDDVAAFDVKENANEVHVSLSGSDKTKKHDDGAKKADKGKNPSNYPDDPDMPTLEDIVYSDDKEDVGAEADFSNLETNISVSLIPTTRVHKDQHVTQIIGDLTLAHQTRSMARMVKEQGGLNQINDKDFHTYLPKGKRAIGSNGVFRNKKDKRGIVIRNKARLVAQGHTQEKGVDYDEVFAPIARIEAIRLFLTYDFFIGFMVYQMNVKSAFLYGAIEKEVYICQPPGFDDPDYPDKVYKVVKALYGLHQAHRAWYKTLTNYLLKNGFHRGKIDQTLFIKKQKGDILLVQVYVDDIIFGSTNKELCKAFEKLMKDKFQMSSMGELTFFLGLQVKQKDDGIFTSQDKYVAEILRKFGFTDVKSASTPIETRKHLLKDLDGEDMDVHIYRSMISSLMYLTSSRLDIMFAVCACTRF
nr:hypothetical protein [Tanacetum cinerariifolium]